MIRIFFIMVLCLYPVLVMAQKSVAAYVLDAETSRPVDLVAIVSPSDYTITNSEGGFVVKVQSGEKITFSHISYETLSVNFEQLSDTIFLQPRVYQLGEVYVLPKDIINSYMMAVWNKYNKLFSRKRERDFHQQTFYYRQLTQNNDLYTEYIESFFTATVNVSVISMTLQEGRFAYSNKDSTGTIMNFFYLSQMTPFSRNVAISRYTVNGFLVKNFKKYYEIRLNRVLSQDTEEEVEVYEFKPYKEMISDNAMMLTGLLYIRSKDMAIVRMEINTKNILLQDIPDVKDESYNIVITYRDGVEEYPIVETVRCDAEVSHIRDGKGCRIKMYSVLFASDYKFESTGKRIRKGDDLLKKVSDSEYNQEFWDNNPIIRRTKVEQQVLDDFNRLGYFGSMNLNKVNE